MSSLKARFTALVIAVALGVAALIVVGEVIRSAREAEDAALARQDASLRAAALAFAYAAPEVEARYGPTGVVERLAWSAPPVFDSHALIDRIGAATGETATVFALGEDGDFWRRTTNIVKPDGSRAVGTPLGKGGAVWPVVSRGQTYRGAATILGKDYLTVYQPIFGAGGAVEGILYVGVAEADVTGVWLRVAGWVTAIALVAVAVAGPAARWLVGRGLAGLDALKADMARLSAGDLATPVSGQAQGDEIGEIARGLDALRAGLAQAAAERSQAESQRRLMLDALAEGVGAVAHAASAGDFSRRVEARFDEPQLAALAQAMNGLCAGVDAFLREIDACVAPMAKGDLTHRLAEGAPGDFGRVARGLNASLDRLTAMLGDIQSAAASGRAAVARLEAGAGEIASRAEGQAASLEQTAAAMEEMSGAVASNAAALDAASASARDVAARTQDGAAAVAATVEAVTRIKHSAGRINEIIGLIEGIAFQTNLLALNASVEAARAGEAGRGFAVVAAEVRALAQRAAAAARDITGLVTESNAQVGDGIARVEQAGAALDAIRAATADLESGIAEIVGAGREQATGVAEINASIAQMDRMTQENAARTEGFAGELGALGADIAALAEAAAAFEAGAARGRRAA
ncbi:MAG: methyl-accepting chemotaxis protein [Rubrimonas sp.]